MNICVVTLYTKEIEIIGSLTEQNHRAYCSKHGYQYNAHFGRISERHAAWDKILAVMRLLPYYDYVMWIDADCVFNNFDKRIEDYFSKCGTFCRDVAYDGNNGQWHYVNTGVFILKHDQKSFDFLNTVWNSHDYKVDELEKRSYNGWPWEQGPVCDYLMKSDDFTVLTDLEFNCHPNIARSDVFIIHYMGWRAGEEVERDYLSRIKKAPGVGLLPT
jgi:hypothetical protein